MNPATEEGVDVVRSWLRRTGEWDRRLGKASRVMKELWRKEDMGAGKKVAVIGSSGEEEGSGPKYGYRDGGVDESTEQGGSSIYGSVLRD